MIKDFNEIQFELSRLERKIKSTTGSGAAGIGAHSHDLYVIKYGDTMTGTLDFADGIGLTSQIVNSNGKRWDPTAANIHNAHADLPTAGGFIYIPPGTYADPNPLTIPDTQTVGFIGAGPDRTRIYYSGASKQPYLTYTSNNEGSFLRDLSIAGANADPAVDILATGTHNGMVTIDHCWIGMNDTYTAANKSWAGLNIECDVFKMSNSVCGAREYGMRLRTGTTDAYIANSTFTSLNEGGESRGIGLWCEDAQAGKYFEGVIHLVNCGFASGAEAACLLRSVANVYGFYCESSILPLKLVGCTLKLFGGSIKTDNTSANYLIDANGSRGVIYWPNMVVPAAANSMINLVRTIN